MTASVRTLRQARRLPYGVAFAGVAAIFAALFLAAGAPTSLLLVYEAEWGFAPSVLTVAFAVYALGLVAAVLVTGKLSDHIGRRPVLIGALALETVAMVGFVVAPDIGWVIAARTVQGIATGAATSALTASLVELAPAHRKRLGTVMAGVAPAGGLGLGALLTGVAVEFTDDPNAVVFIALTVVMALGTILLVFNPETVTRQPGALRSLIPRPSVPRAARRTFVAAVPLLIAGWMAASLFLGLSPSIVRDIFGIHSGFIIGLSAFVAPATASLASWLMGSVDARRTAAIGGASVVVGAIGILIATSTGSLAVLLLVGGLFGGFGFGSAFSGTLRLLGPLAETHQRAGLFAAVYLVSYLSFGIPAIIAGQLVGPLGLEPTALGFGAAIVVVAALGLAAQFRASRSESVAVPAMS